MSVDRKALVIKFLHNECDPEEAALAEQYLDADPALLEELLPKAEWDEAGASLMPAGVETGIRQKLEAVAKRGRFYYMLRPAAIAASVLLILTLAIGGMLLNRQDKKAVAGNQAAPAVSQYDTVYNTNNTVKDIFLADGSRVILHGHSSLVYARAFGTNRQLELKGTARFFVAKNPEAPFVVRSGDVSTTALGTVFEVNASLPAAAVRVNLYEGKVVIRSVHPQLAIKETYLHPGEQCVVDLAMAKVRVSKIATQLVRRVSLPKASAPAVKEESEDLSLHFDKADMAGAFNRLQKIFNASIRYDAVELHKMLFTGSFTESDSLSQILRIIGNMNGLLVAEKNGVYTISKRKHPKQDELAAQEPVVIPAAKVQAPPVGSVPEPAAAKELPGTAVAAIEASAPAAPMIRETPAGVAYQKIPLADLFDRLAKKAAIRINYQKDHIQELFFTGTIPADLSPVNMLKVICTMNNLELVKIRRGNYTVKPSLP